MNYFRNALLVIVSLLVAFPVSGALFGPHLKAYTLTAPEKLLKGVRQIAILDFESPKRLLKEVKKSSLGHIISAESVTDKEVPTTWGKDITNYMSALLLEEYLGANHKKVYVNGGKTNVFKVVERSNIEGIIREQKLQISGAVATEQAASIGKLAGVQAIVSGKVSYSSKIEKQHQQYKDKKGVTHHNYILKKTVKVDVTMKIVSVETAAVIGTKTVARTLTDSKNSKKSYPSESSLADDGELVLKGLKLLAFPLVAYFSPHYDYASFPIEKVKGKEFKEKGKVAGKLLRNGKINEAYFIYKDLFDKDNYNSSIAYNLGAIYEVIGHFEQAKECYGIAMDLVDARKFRMAYDRMENGIEMLGALKEAGVEIKPYNFSESKAERAMAEKVEVKGSRSKRTPVYSGPHDKAEVITQVPGGISLRVAGREGNYVKVLLRGGKEGYIHKNFLK